MFKICKADLSLSHPDIQQVIQGVNKAEISTIHYKPHKIFKFIWFLNNQDRIENPVTLMTWGNQAFEVHPGHFRFLAAYHLGKPSIESIVLYTDFDYVEKISKNIKYRKIKVSLSKQAGSGWYMINIPNHNKYQKTKQDIEKLYKISREYYVKNFLRKYGNFSIIFQDQELISSYFDHKKTTKIHVDNKLDIFKKITEVFAE